MAGRRSNGEGSIYYDSKREEFIGIIRYGSKSEGTLKKKTFRSGKGGKKSDVAKQMTEWRLEHQADYCDDHRVKLETSIKVWADTVKKTSLKPSSFDRLESTINCQVIPRIGWYYLDELTDSIIQTELISPILEDDGLSVSTGKKAYNCLNEFLKYATFKHYIRFNPMAIMKAPKPKEHYEVSAESQDETMTEADKALSREETATLRTVLYQRWHRPPQNRRFVNGGAMDLILNTGLRMGEALALKWSDINFDKKTLSVTKNLITVKNREKTGSKYKLIIQEKPKTEKSKRILPLNKAALAALEDLKTAPGYNPGGFVIHTKTGMPVLPRSFEQTLELMCRAAGIRRVGVHALRHTYATRLFEKRVDIKVISELLGHSSTEITYKVYIHVIDSLKESAVEAIDLD